MKFFCLLLIVVLFTLPGSAGVRIKNPRPALKSQPAAKGKTVAKKPARNRKVQRDECAG